MKKGRKEAKERMRQKMSICRENVLYSVKKEYIKEG